MKKLISTAICVTVIVGCASSSGVLKKGPDTFSITTSANQTSTAKKRAFKEANRECTRSGKVISIIEETADPINNAGAINFNMTFKCISPNKI
jgi:hypothetical protein